MISEYIKLLRQKKKIKQYMLLPEKSKSQSSKVESNDVVFTIELLQELCNNLGLTMEEFIHITETDSSEEQLLHEYRFCLKYLDKQPEKQNLLNKFNVLYSKEPQDLTLKESRLIFTIRATLGLFWKEIPKLDKLTVLNMYKDLIKQDFYSQYDYMVLCNGATLFTLTQLKSLVKKAYPVYLNQKRNNVTKVYATMFMMNVIDIFINHKQYQKALFYSDVLLRHTDIHRDYYTNINIQYMRNICLGFLNHDSKQFDKAFELLDILRKIGDSNAADQLETGLRKMLENPDIFLNNQGIEYIKLNNID